MSKDKFEYIYKKIRQQLKTARYQVLSRAAFKLILNNHPKIKVLKDKPAKEIIEKLELIIFKELIDAQSDRQDPVSNLL